MILLARRNRFSRLVSRKITLGTAVSRLAPRSSDVRSPSFPKLSGTSSSSSLLALLEGARIASRDGEEQDSEGGEAEEEMVEGEEAGAPVNGAGAGGSVGLAVGGP